MQPLQLTADERVGLSERFQDEFTSTDSTSTVVTFENYETLSLVLEYDVDTSALIISFKLESMTEKTPEAFLGCPQSLEKVNSLPVDALCEEIDVLLETEFSVNATVQNASFTFYEWETDTGWYIYEMEV